MGKRTAEQKEEVNNTHCLVCFKLRTSILICLCTSLLLLIVYGYEYWIDQEIRENSPESYYFYIVIAAIEFIFCAIGWFGVHNHHRKLTAYLLYWILIHIVILVIVFWVSQIFDYLHFAFYIVWIALQIITIILIHFYKQLLKRVYGWDDDDDEIDEKTEDIPTVVESPKPEINEQKHKGSTVTVNVSVNMPQPQAPVYQQPPQAQSRPLNMAPQYLPQQQPPPQHYAPQPMQNATPPPVQQMQNNPPYVPNQSMVGVVTDQRDRTGTAHSQKLGDLASYADHPNSVRNAAYSQHSQYSQNNNVNSVAPMQEMQAVKTVDSDLPILPNDTMNSELDDDDDAVYEDPMEGGEGGANEGGGYTTQLQQNITPNEVAKVDYEPVRNARKSQAHYNNDDEKDAIDDDDDMDMMLHAVNPANGAHTKGFDGLHFLDMDPDNHGTKGLN